jgi:hypothetical protein
VPNEKLLLEPTTMATTLLETDNVDIEVEEFACANN